MIAPTPKTETKYLPYDPMMLHRVSTLELLSSINGQCLGTFVRLIAMMRVPPLARDPLIQTLTDAGDRLAKVDPNIIDIEQCRAIMACIIDAVCAIEVQKTEGCDPCQDQPRINLALVAQQFMGATDCGHRQS
jgi:hypothetical protein